MQTRLLFFTSILILIYGCNADINDKDKRNENWAYWIDSKTGKASWVPLKDVTTVKDGNYTSFYSSGSIYEKGKLKNGKNIDTIYWYDQNEKLIHLTFIKSNVYTQYYKYNGPYISYFQNGNVFEKGIIENHKFKDDWTRYYLNGQIEWSTNLKNGTGTKLWYFEDGQMSHSTDYVNGKIDGLNKSWHSNGQIKEISNWKNGIQNGLYESFFPDGKPESKTNWLNNRVDGKSEWWYQSGQKKNIIFYKSDLMDGYNKQWYPNGKLHVEGNFILGKKNGKVARYYENGNIQAEGFFKDDKEDGIFKWYDKNGQIKNKIVYANGIVIDTLQ
ncbi:toxin-antitoxin system YwqK family antitoxin [Flavobacterium sp. SORGH_AS_0622]|uniref:toxin-antitoxin system YwqK family antitoxin n=1 Tax=Flavobacterium sp. SORGH_AS_0622 TaxID=3041772 RepID=UPI00277E6DCE|nr:toxin-antitoxin system YwqK family antitoxin [Flavobacterium sp. SORGH_AS_0622]MDQ1164876.1 antitoxin component YwqK of YwqJK toxin-antitoxin module [Flavobacterium sp. SORGH_AS_0622]